MININPKMLPRLGEIDVDLLAPPGPGRSREVAR
jgi:hypothetical protein